MKERFGMEKRWKPKSVVELTKLKAFLQMPVRVLNTLRLQLECWNPVIDFFFGPKIKPQMFNVFPYSFQSVYKVFETHKEIPYANFDSTVSSSDVSNHVYVILYIVQL